MSKYGQKLKRFLGNYTKYDAYGQMIFACGENGIQLIVDVRGWGAIQNLYKRKDGTIDIEAAQAFQDKLGEFITEAIEEKIEKEFYL